MDDPHPGRRDEALNVAIVQAIIERHLEDLHAFAAVHG
jgi:hypothetical protein